jgi:hypothetical protein
VKRAGHPLGRRRLPATLLVVCLCMTTDVVSKAEKSKAPKNADEAEQWLRKDLEAIRRQSRTSIVLRGGRIPRHQDEYLGLT